MQAEKLGDSIDDVIEYVRRRMYEDKMKKKSNFQKHNTSATDCLPANGINRQMSEKKKKSKTNQTFAEIYT